MSGVLSTTDLSSPVHRGKVRDIYDLGEVLLLVATERLSAFDVVLPDGIPEKGVVLNEMSRFSFQKTAHLTPNHFIAMGSQRDQVDHYVRDLPREVARRSMLVKKAKPVLVECVVRGYLAGSAWAEYRRSGTVGGSNAPSGLRESQLLERPLFTPTTKAQTGHDEPMTASQLERQVGPGLARELERLTLGVYAFAQEYARGRGMIIADTKMEFGLIGDRIILIDELLTPDSSRFWDAALYQPGRSQDSLDKQFVRDWLTRSGWNKEPPTPRLPAEVVQQTARRYKEVYQRLTGQPLPS